MNPSPEQIRSRETAMQAERHWWRSRVETLAGEWREEAAHYQRNGEVLASAVCEIRAGELDALIAERNPR